MSIGLRLDLKQTQQLVMTPQLQQAIKLLQMSNLELAEFVEHAAEQNPLIAIEQGDGPGPVQAPAGAPDMPEPAGPVATDQRVTAEGDHSLGDETFDTGAENLHDGGPRDGAAPPSRLSGPLGGRDEDGPSLEERLAGRTGLREHLRAQLGQARTDGADGALPLVARYLVEELDEDGYLRADLLEIAGRLGVPPATAEAALALLQGCEPTGVGARGLAECLALQLRERDRLDPAMQALLGNLDLLARGDWKRLRAVCGVDAEDLADMVGELRRLDPRPCSAFGAVEPETVIPDILLRRTAWGGWHLELNAETLPRVLLDRDYAAEIGARDCAETRRYLADCMASANWLIRSLDQRARTILKIATEIVRHQQRFFDEGIAGLRPLNLRTVAEAVGMHESTASRVTSNKYIATERGIFELKFFFTNAVGGDEGGIAAESVRHRIKAMVDAEPSAAVLSDDEIVDRLHAEGVEIARRTVAKYRKSLNIPSSIERRRRKALRAAS
jgi:RNA polymerase sigma-54 factor